MISLAPRGRRTAGGTLLVSGAGLLLFWAAALSLSACDEAPPRLVSCSGDASCPAGYHCGPSLRCVGDVPCVEDTGCCLGERCQLGRCRVRTMCSDNAPCGAPGLRCVHGLCVPDACGQDVDCPVGRRCLAGLCLKGSPCAGHCPGDEVCAPLLDRCVSVSGASLSCPTGSLVMLKNDADFFSEGCAEVAPSLQCFALPELIEGDYGWPSVLVDLGTSLLVFARDRSWGDLVLARHDRGPPFARRSLTVLAGLPKGAPVVGDPKGPRGGVNLPGPDVGRVLDAAAGPGQVVHVVFRDDSADALSYLRLGSDGLVHARHDLASGGGVGAALAIAVRADGRPVVASFSPASTQHPSALKLYEAHAASPAKVQDWKVTLIASTSLPEPVTPCGGACPTGRVCVVASLAKGSSPEEACIKPGQGCAACLPSEICSGGLCLARRLSPAPLRTPAVGVGAQLDVLTQGQEVYLAAWDYLKGQLYVFHRGMKGPPTEQLVTGASVPGGSSDVGRFPHLWVDPEGAVMVSCQDAAAGRLLRVRLGSSLKVVVTDDGVRADGHHRVGADVRVQALKGGGVLAVYQDTRRSQIVVASVGADGVVVERTELAGTGASGFSPGIAVLGSKLLVVSSTSLSLAKDGRMSTQVRLQSVVLSAP